MRQERPWLWSQAPLWLAVGKQSPQEVYWDLTKQDQESTSTITFWTPNFNTGAPREGREPAMHLGIKNVNTDVSLEESHCGEDA